MKLHRRTVLFSFLGVLVFCAILLIGGVVYLRSEAGSARLMAWARDVLERDFGTKLEYSEGRVDVFSGLHFKNLKITRATEEQKADIFVESLDADYAVSLLGRSIDVRSIRIIRPAIKLVMHSSEKPTEAEPEEDSGPGALEKQILDPMATVVIREFVLEHLDVDLDQEAPGARTKAKVRDFGLSFDLEMKKERLRSSGQFKLGGKTELELESSGPTADGRQTAQTVLKALASGKWDFGVYREGGKWVHELKAAQLEGELEDVVLHQRSPNAQSDLSLSRLKLASGQKLLARTRRLFILNADSLQNVDLGAELTTGPLSLKQTREGKRTELAIASQKLKAVSHLESEIGLDLSYEADQLRSEELLAKPADLRFKTEGTITRDLRSAKLRSHANLGGIEILTVTSDLRPILELEPAETAPPIWREANFKIMVALALDNKLATILKPAAKLKETGSIQAALDFDGQRERDGSAVVLYQATLPQVKLPGIGKVSAVELSGKAWWQAQKQQANLTVQLSAISSELGAWAIKSELQAAVPKTENEGLKSQGKTVFASAAPARKGKLPVAILEPLTLSHSVDMTPGRQALEFKLDVPSMEIEDVGRAQSTKMTATVRSPDLAAAKDLDVSVQLSQVALDLAQPLGAGLKRLTGLQMNASGGMRSGRDFALSELKASFANPSIGLTAQANGDTKAKNVLAQLALDLSFPQKFSPTEGQQISGRIKIPASLTVAQGEEINLKGGIDLSGFAWSNGPISLAGVSGRLPFAESLKWNGKELRFTHLITQNPFERVDFERVRPLLQGTERLTIDKIRWEDKTYGPLIGFFSLKQNMISVHQFDLDLASGRSYGQMYFDAYPANLQLGILARMTALDLGEILPSKFLSRVPQGEKKISGRTGFVLDLRKSTMDGRMDITEIGGPQLIALLGVLDPSYEDEKLNKVRGLLQVGYPTEVALDFNDGYLNLDVALKALGLVNRQRLTSIPVSGLLSKATADLIKTTEKGPLK